MRDRKRGLLLSMAMVQLGEMAVAVNKELELLIIRSRTDSPKTQQLLARQDLAVLPHDQLNVVTTNSRKATLRYKC